ncbi:MAG TPA: hypothetical protein VHW01_21225, partial [Polyangiaceae bacterium]|nr:hypothetical protein [Polyangiaceae bacterium]
MKRRLQALTAWRRPAFLMFAESAPLDLRIVGRTLLHAAAVGVAAAWREPRSLLGSSISRASSW